MKRVFVGLSGGVDSSVAAALLQKQGYDVVGVFIKIWQPEFTECSWPEDRRSAMRVAAHLKIPFLTVDLSKEYKRDVLSYMVREYRRGRTPNPDVECNRAIKFGAFLKWARAQGADFVATGHYAQVKKGKHGYELHQSVDQTKDQSYFLWTLGQKELAHILFPVGGLKKIQVRRLAKQFGLPTFDRPDSQGLCFVGALNLRDFLGHYLPLKSGKVLDESRRRIGHHGGAHAFTLGQRHGFSVTSSSAVRGPQYVVAIDIKRNSITVSPKPTESPSASRHVRIDSIHGVGTRPHGALKARFRYRQPLMPVSVAKGVTSFEEPVLAPRGQSLVFYRASECLGGGIVK